jgi:hypothetical protein
MTNDVLLQIGVDTKAALRNIQSFQQETQKSVSSISKAFDGLKTVAIAAAGVFAGRAVINGINAVIDAASRQQDAVNNLNTALKVAGDFSEEASRDFQDFASSIQAVTKFGDEAVLEQVALAKAFGATNEQAKLVVEAATELSAATGKSLEEATRQVSKTLGGFAGELGEVNPLIKSLTKEQLAAGEAARVLIQQYSGSAAGQVKTFSGATAQLSNSYGDLLEKFGQFIIESPFVINAINAISDGINLFGNSVEGNREGVNSLIKGTIQFGLELSKLVTNVLGFAIQAFLKFQSIIEIVISKIFGLTASFLKFSPLAGILSKLGVDTAGLGDEFKLLELASQRASEQSQKNFEGVGKGVEVVTDFVDDLNKKASAVNKTLATTAKVGNEVSKVAPIAQSQAPVPVKVEAEAKKSANDVGQGIADTLTGGLASALNPVVGVVQGAIGAVQGLIDVVPNILNAIGGIFKSLTNLPNAIFDALEGLLDALVDFVASFLPNLVRSIGRLLTKFVTFLLRDLPKAFLSLVRELPAIFKDLFKELPNLIITLLEELPTIVTEFVELLVDAIPSIIDSLVTSLITNGGIVRIAVALARALVIDLPIALARGFINAISNIGGSVFKNLGNIFSGGIKLPKLDFSGLSSAVNDFLKKILDLPGQIADSILKALGLKGGSGEGVAKQVFTSPDVAISNLLGGNQRKKILGFAEGGLVPSGFPNDTFPARLTSGEQVIDRTDNKRLSRFLDSQENANQSPQVINLTLKVGESELAKVLLNLNRQGFRTA